MLNIKSQSGNYLEVVTCSNSLFIKTNEGLVKIDLFNYINGVVVAQGIDIVITNESKKLLANAIDDLLSLNHEWVLISHGMYDNLYECRRCHKRHCESIDDPSSQLPKGGCIN